MKLLFDINHKVSGNVEFSPLQFNLQSLQMKQIADERFVIHLPKIVSSEEGDSGTRERVSWYFLQILHFHIQVYITVWAFEICWMLQNCTISSLIININHYHWFFFTADVSPPIRSTLRGSLVASLQMAKFQISYAC